jgi:hypothetical protein
MRLNDDGIKDEGTSLFEVENEGQHLPTFDQPMLYAFF